MRESAAGALWCCHYSKRVSLSYVLTNCYCEVTNNCNNFMNNCRVLDLLRQQHFTVGRAWCHEYGCSDNKEYFESLLKYSPLHNIRVPEKEDVQYPAVLIMAGDHDDRVVPVHSYKYAAELQHTIGKSSKQVKKLFMFSVSK